MTGVEAVVSLTDIEREIEDAEKQRVIDILSDPAGRDPGLSSAERKLNQLVQSIIMRARANPQRHYEVYTITTTPGITADTLRELFEDNPQGGADLIRARGNKVYSDRVEKRTQVIV